MVFGVFLFTPLTLVQRFAATEKLLPLDRSETSILAQLKNKYQKGYENFSGVEGIYMLDIKEMNPNNANKVVSTGKAKVIRRDFFYKKPDLVVLEYEKDGKALSPSKYNPPSFEPIFPLFDKDGEKHYNIKIQGIIEKKGKAMYKMRVVPKKKGIRYFTGYAYYDKENLQPISMRGSLAANYFFLKEIFLEMGQREVNGMPAMQSMVIQTRVFAPMIIKDRRYVTRMRAKSLKLIN